MTQPEHPSAEQISDLLAGVLPAAEAMDANAHLASCEACRDERDALLDLTALLSDEGATSLEMPSDVAMSIDAAISRASAERAAGIPTIDPAQRTSGSRFAGRQPLRWLGGAAAAVLVAGVGFAGLQALPESNTAGSQASSPEHGKDAVIPSAGGGSTREPTAPRTRDLAGADVYHVNSPTAVPHAALQFSMAASKAVPPRAAGCATPITGGLTTVIRYEGHLAVLTVSRDTRLVIIYDCATATKTLLITDY